jgi:hypothetical protein
MANTSNADAGARASTTAAVLGAPGVMPMYVSGVKLTVVAAWPALLDGRVAGRIR